MVLFRHGVIGGPVQHNNPRKRIIRPKPLLKPTLAIEALVDEPEDSSVPMPEVEIAIPEPESATPETVKEPVVEVEEEAKTAPEEDPEDTKVVKIVKKKKTRKKRKRILTGGVSPK